MYTLKRYDSTNTCNILSYLSPCAQRIIRTINNIMCHKCIFSEILNIYKKKHAMLTIFALISKYIAVFHRT